MTALSSVSPPGPLSRADSLFKKIFSDWYYPYILWYLFPGESPDGELFKIHSWLVCVVTVGVPVSNFCNGPTPTRFLTPQHILLGADE